MLVCTINRRLVPHMPGTLSPQSFAMKTIGVPSLYPTLSLNLIIFSTKHAYGTGVLWSKRQSKLEKVMISQFSTVRKWRAVSYATGNGYYLSWTDGWIRSTSFYWSLVDQELNSWC